MDIRQGILLLATILDSRPGIHRCLAKVRSVHVQTENDRVSTNQMRAENVAGRGGTTLTEDLPRRGAGAPLALKLHPSASLWGSPAIVTSSTKSVPLRMVSAQHNIRNTSGHACDV
jgi:hypothetical protein